MSRNLRNKCRRIVYSLLAVTVVLGGVTPVSYLKAASINAPVQDGKNCVTIGETTITFNGISEGKHQVEIKGVPMKKPIMNVTIERKSGFNEATHASLKGEGTVTINGESVKIHMIGIDEMKTIGDNKMSVEVSIMPDLEASKEKLAKMNFSADLLKGKEIKLNIKKVEFLKYEKVISKEFAAQLKKVPTLQGISFKEAGIKDVVPLTAEEKKYLPDVKKVIPAKGLNIPIAEGGANTIDNIGFVDGALQIRTKGNCHFIFSKGQNEGVGCYGLDKDFSAFKIKDQAALNQYQVQVSSVEIKASEKESKTVSCIF